METLFLERDLPLNDLEKLGLYRDGKVSLDREDLDAMLSGRRTDLVSLSNLQSDSFRIERLDARLSLDQSADGRIALQLHPIYKEPRRHSLLTAAEAEQLEQGTLTHLRKDYQTPEGKKESRVIEYDRETREFIAYDPDKVTVPEKVNGEALSDQQKGLFRNGDPVRLSEGTIFQHRAGERKGILSDRRALVLSVLLDGGISYLAIRGLRNILNNSQKQHDEYSRGYRQALQEMEKYRAEPLLPDPALREQEVNRRAQHNRGYGRGSSR